ncbi:uncharacterized protein LOC109822069 isoform X2 [Asparagus officinalis]|uniref:uncharacterized protein LOC109822069 isoform X2 n=1 Tax=Asparagus officinalis TaxID=4686 RepID=UPI00098E7895|nr:uncharacterized protein LOC109822069 isoform X2 [Asparagus officinalis]
MAKPATTLFAIFILLIPAANATPSPSLQPTLEELERFLPIEEAPSPSLGADSVEDLKFMLPFLNGECWSTIKDVPGCAGEQPGYGWVPVQSPNNADDAFPVWDPEQDKFKQDTSRPGSSSGQPINLRRPIEAVDLDDNDEEEAPSQSSRAHPEKRSN